MFIEKIHDSFSSVHFSETSSASIFRANSFYLSHSEAPLQQPILRKLGNQVRKMSPTKNTKKTFQCGTQIENEEC